MLFRLIPLVLLLKEYVESIKDERVINDFLIVLNIFIFVKDRRFHKVWHHGFRKVICMNHLILLIKVVLWIYIIIMLTIVLISLVFHSDRFRYLDSCSKCPTVFLISNVWYFLFTLIQIDWYWWTYSHSQHIIIQRLSIQRLITLSLYLL